jgi:hypothetical protein
VKGSAGLVCLLAAGAMLVGCSGRESAPSAGSSVVKETGSSVGGGTGSSVATENSASGTLEMVGGPAPGSPRPVPGTVMFRSTGAVGRTYSATAGADGHFELGLPPGSYMVTGRSPLYVQGLIDCQAGAPVMVSGAVMAPVLVTCQVR